MLFRSPDTLRSLATWWRGESARRHRPHGLSACDVGLSRGARVYRQVTGRWITAPLWVVLALAAGCMSGPRLSDRPSTNTDLSGHWVLDPAASDDAAVLVRAALPHPKARPKARYDMWGNELPEGADPGALPPGTERGDRRRAGKELIAAHRIEAVEDGQITGDLSGEHVHPVRRIGRRIHRGGRGRRLVSMVQGRNRPAGFNRGDAHPRHRFNRSRGRLPRAGDQRRRPDHLGSRRPRGHRRALDGQRR